MAHNIRLKINDKGNYAEYKDEDGDRFTIEIFSTGKAQIAVRDNCMNDMMCNLSNRAMHELRDMLNKRYPNATAVQGD
jgi:hypothetical protein